MTVTDTLANLAAELHRLGDPATADTVTTLAVEYQTGSANVQAVLDTLDSLITLQQVRS